MKLAIDLCILLATTLALAQDKNPVTSVVKEILPRQQKNLVAAVEGMPSEKFSYKPTEQQMTFGHLVLHMIEANNHLCSKIGDVPEPKAAALKESDGKEKLAELLGEGGPAAWEDDGFGVHFAFFGQTRADVRLRILEGRRSRLEERMEAIRAAFTRTRERVDSYTLELHRHGLESVEREVRWLNELIASERQAGGHDNISEKESS